MNNESSGNWKLGVFITFGVLLFVVAIYFIGVNRNLFGSNFVLRSEFKDVSGLKQGSNVRLSGINIGTVSKIDFISDSLVLVKLLIRKDVQQYIKTDAIASIGSDGLVGDKVLIITPGSTSNTMVNNNDLIASFKVIEIEDILSSVKASADNAKIITDQFVQFSNKMNDKNGLLYKIMTNQDFAFKIDNIINNLQVSVNEIARFTPKMNDKNGVIDKVFTNKDWANSLEKSIYNLQSSSNDISGLTTKLNDKNNMISQILYNDTIVPAFNKTIRNLEISSNELVKFTSKINNDETVLSKLINNPKLAKSLDSTLINIEKRVEEFKELEEAAKNNFLLKSYFKKKNKKERKE